MEKSEEVGFIEYLRGKYRRARKGAKSVLIDEVSKKLQVSRKHASRLLATQAVGRPRKPERRGRPSKYQRHDFKQALRKLWQLQGYICGRALKGSMLEWVRALEAEDGAYDPVIRQLLLQVSPATVDCILREYKTQRGKSYTSSAAY